MSSNSTYSVLPEDSGSGSSPHLSQIAGMYDLIHNFDGLTMKGKKKKKNRKKVKKKSSKSFEKVVAELHGKSKKSKKAKKLKKKSKERAEFDMWLRVAEKSIDCIRDTTLDTASYIVKRHVDHAWPAVAVIDSKAKDK